MRWPFDAGLRQIQAGSACGRSMLALAGPVFSLCSSAGSFVAEPFREGGSGFTRVACMCLHLAMSSMENTTAKVVVPHVNDIH